MQPYDYTPALLYRHVLLASFGTLSVSTHHAQQLTRALYSPAPAYTPADVLRRARPRRAHPDSHTNEVGVDDVPVQPLALQAWAAWVPLWQRLAEQSPSPLMQSILDYDGSTPLPDDPALHWLHTWREAATRAAAILGLLPLSCAAAATRLDGLMRAVRPHQRANGLPPVTWANRSLDFITSAYGVSYARIDT